MTSHRRQIRIAELETEVRKLVDFLFPSDHAVGAILEHEHDEIQLEPHGRLKLLRIHHEAAIAADGEHALSGWISDAAIAEGRPAPMVASALSSSSVLATLVR